MSFEKKILEGDVVRLEPLCSRHAEGLSQAISDGQLWKLFFTSVPHVNDIEDFLDGARKAHQSGDGLVYATIDKASGKVAGSTRFMHASLADKRVEIGFTFLARSFQRTKVNTEAKLLMLTHAFEQLGLNRVEFLTDYLNTASRNAILRLGAKQEGILRNHKLMPDGRIRDSVIFSIINHEWAGVKQSLHHKLGMDFKGCP